MHGEPSRQTGAAPCAGSDRHTVRILRQVLVQFSFVGTKYSGKATFELRIHKGMARTAIHPRSLNRSWIAGRKFFQTFPVSISTVGCD